MNKVSIIIPVYNAAAYIEQCIRTVMQQDCAGLDCLLVDDCGTDQSMSIVRDLLQAYQGPVAFRIFQQERNMGAAAARNRGIREAAADYLYFLDADDELYPGTISDMLRCVEQHPGLQLVQGEMYCEDSRLNAILSIKHKNFPDFTNDLAWLRNHFLLDVPVSPGNRLVSLSFIRTHGIYFKEGILHEDILWRFMLSKHISSVAFTRHVGYRYNYNGNSVMTAAGNDLKRIYSQIWVIDYISRNTSANFAYIEQLSLLRQFHYAATMKILPENRIYRNRLLKEQIHKKLLDDKLSPLFKMSYLLLLSGTLLKYGSWLWNKNMGLLFRVSKNRTRHVIQKQLNQHGTA